jgi:hypothetical protein
MTDLTKDELRQRAESAQAAGDKWFTADTQAVLGLVAEVERLKAVIDGKQDLWKLGHLMHEAWLQSDLKQKSHELTIAVTVMEQVIARNEALKSDRDDWKARALKVEQAAAPQPVADAMMKARK